MNNLLEIKVKRLYPINKKEGKGVKAYADIVINDALMRCGGASNSQYKISQMMC